MQFCLQSLEIHIERGLLTSTFTDTDRKRGTRRRCSSAVLLDLEKMAEKIIRYLKRE